MSRSEKLLVVCGPTGVGKTKLAFRLAKKFNGELVSADSRQVYKGLDLVTGKEEMEGVKTWLLSVAEPQEEFSVSHYCKLASEAFEDIWRRGKLPILVGGTGLYVKALIDGIETIDIPPDKDLREACNDKDKKASELFEVLRRTDREAADSLNESERKNKQRLMRRIEVAKWRLEVGNWKLERDEGIRDTDVLVVGLRTPREVLKERISKRVDEWMSKGVEKETEELARSGVSWDSQVMTALGCRAFKDYFDGKIGREEAFERWKRADWQLARRQMTWFKRDKRIRWFDITEPKFTQNVEKLVQKWYNIR